MAAPRRALIRARQAIMTRLFPHQANKIYIVPSRVKGKGVAPAAAPPPPGPGP